MTFDKMMSMEPRLKDIEAATIAAAHAAGPGNYWQEWERIKTELRAVVGWNRYPADKLSTSDAFETASVHLFRLYEETSGKVAEGVAI